MITIEIVGAFLGLEQDKALHQYFCEHWKTHFPKLGERSTFARQAFNLWHVKKLVHQELVTRLDARESNLFLTDGFPLPVHRIQKLMSQSVGLPIAAILVHKHTVRAESLLSKIGDPLARSED